MSPAAGTELGLATTVNLEFPAAVAKAEAALEAQGFGILTRIDVQATLREKLGVEMDPFLILGACNPPIAHRALEAEPRVSLLMPCNVVVRQAGDGKVRVEAMNPALMATMFPGVPALAPLAGEARERIARAVDAIGSSAVDSGGRRG